MCSWLHAHKYADVLATQLFNPSIISSLQSMLTSPEWQVRQDALKVLGLAAGYGEAVAL